MTRFASEKRSTLKGKKLLLKGVNYSQPDTRYNDKIRYNDNSLKR